MVINGETLWKMSPIKSMLNYKEKDHGVSHGLSEAGYDIRIKQSIDFYPPQYHAFDSTRLVQREQIVRIEENSKEEVFYSRFCLASAIEEFDMPNNMVAIVHDKSSWARQGLSVFNTVIEPGWKGFLTLELVFHGNTNIHIPVGAGIAQVIFHELEENSSYQGKYQNQENKPVNTIFES